MTESLLVTVGCVLWEFFVCSIWVESDMAVCGKWLTLEDVSVRRVVGAFEVKVNNISIQGFWWHIGQRYHVEF